MSQITNEELKDIRNKIGSARAWQIRDALQAKGIMLDESTIRGRFIEMGEPLGSQGITTADALRIKPEEPKEQQQPKTPPREIKKPDKTFDIPPEMTRYIPDEALFTGYIERPIDNRLSIHYDSGKYPLTQGKQGTGKTFSHMFYAFKNKLPFFLISCYEDMKLKKYFGDKTIEQGTIKFREGILVQAVQHPSVILFDEINAISNANSYDFHALLQNRELMVKDANDGKGEIYRLHKHCRIGFAQNPKSAKYIGGNIKPSNFLGRCTYITYPEFTKKEITKFVKAKFPTLTEEEAKKFVEFYFACNEAIEKAEIPVDISIRQLNNVIDLYVHGLTLENAIEDGMTSILEAISQPKNKEAFYRLAQAVWKNMMDKSISENTGTLESFILSARRIKWDRLLRNTKVNQNQEGHTKYR